MPTAHEADETFDPSVVGLNAADATEATPADVLAPPELGDADDDDDDDQVEALDIVEGLVHEPNPVDVELAPVQVDHIHHDHHQVQVHHQVVHHHQVHHHQVHHHHGIHVDVENPELPPPMPMGEEHEHHHHPDDDDAVVPTITGAVVDPLAVAAQIEDVAAAAAENAAHDSDQAALDAGEEAAAAAMEAAAAAEAAEAAIGNVLDDTHLDVHTAAAAAAAAEAAAADHSHSLVEQQQHQHDMSVAHTQHTTTVEEDEVAWAADAAAAAVQAADGMAVVVDQALLATAAAAAASQVAEVLAEQQPHGGHHQDSMGGHPQHLRMDQYMSPPGLGDLHDHGDLLQARREKDRKRYSAMTPEARAAYNAHRRELYHKQGEAARKRRRERERDRYHSLEGDDKKTRNERRAKLERDRYNRLSKDELANRNSKRRDRAKDRKGTTPNMTAAGVAIAASPQLTMAMAQPVTTLEMGMTREMLAASTIPPPQAQHHADPQALIKTEVVVHDGGAEGDVHTLPEMDVPEVHTEHEFVGAPLPEATVDVDAHHMADASALAAEVAEQVIAGSNLEGTMVEEATVTMEDLMEEEGPTVQI